MDPNLVTFLLINMLVAGIVGTLAVQHAIAHFRPKEKPAPKQPEALPKMLPAMKQQLLEEAEKKFRDQITQSTTQLERDLVKTTSELSSHVTKIGGDIISVEMQRYRESLESLRKQTEVIIKQAQQGVAQHQQTLDQHITTLTADLEAKTKADLDAYKEKMIASIDTKLSDAVSSFLVNTLQHNVDLGAQTDYMLAMLDEHKKDIVGEVTRD